MIDRHRDGFRLSFISSASQLVVPPLSEILSRLRSAVPWDEASIHAPDSDFPRAHISWHQAAGFNVHCFENDRSSGLFLVTRVDFSAPSVEINLGGHGWSWFLKTSIPGRKVMRDYLRSGDADEEA